MDQTTPKDVETFFNIETRSRDPAVPYFVKQEGVIRRKDAVKTALILMPEEFIRALDSHVIGATSTAIVGLAEFALRVLDERKLMLVVDNKYGQ